MKHGLIKKIEELDTAFEQSFSSYVSETEKDAKCCKCDGVIKIILETSSSCLKLKLKLNIIIIF